MQYQKITRTPLVRGNFLTNKIYFRNMGICSDDLYLLKLLVKYLLFVRNVPLTKEVFVIF